jgi:formyltetrahydrofolate deformylase
MSNNYRLIVSCPDRVGIVARVSSLIAEKSGWILEASHHSDRVANWFFMRYVISAESLGFDFEGFRDDFIPLAEEFQMRWKLIDAAQPQKVIIMASRDPHCLADLLHRWQNDDLPCEICCVISNHDTLRRMVEWNGIPFHYVPVTPENKPEAFGETREIIERYQADTVVLARYMQIIPPDLCHDYYARMINIHHSFLPSFAGAKPYHQAYDRGVKLIGATCHYVTEELDAGPIIEQDVVRVGHQVGREEMTRLGKDVERLVLYRGLRYHLEDRILIHGNKTIVFS